jgi:drug/metabolite transporter (DMT)-like permease
MNKYFIGHLQVVLATFLIAGSFIASADISQELHPISLNLMRFFIAALVLAPFIVLKKNALKQLKNVLPRSMVISFFYCSYFACVFAAMLTTTTLNVGSIYTLTPLITALLSIIVFKQSFAFKTLVIYLLGVVGTLWAIFGGSFERFLMLNLNQGDLIISGGVLCMAGYTISMKALYRQDDVTIMTFANLLCGIIWMSIAASIGDISLEWHQLESRYYPSMAYLAIAATFLTSYLYQKASTVLQPVNVASYIYLNPLCVALLSMIILKEHVDSILWWGIAASAIATLILQHINQPKNSISTD